MNDRDSFRLSLWPNDVMKLFSNYIDVKGIFVFECGGFETLDEIDSFLRNIDVMNLFSSFFRACRSEDSPRFMFVSISGSSDRFWKFVYAADFHTLTDFPVSSLADC